MSHYHDPSDMKLIGDLLKAAPDEVNAWLKLDGIVGREDGAIPRKYRELIAVACALHTQCVYCIEAHSRGAQQAGASEAELAEAAMIGTALRAGGSGAHSALALKFFRAAGGPDSDQTGG